MNTTTHRAPRPWLAPLITGAVALLLGAVLGWFGHQGYMRVQLADALDDAGAELEAEVDTSMDEPGPEMSEADEETGNTGGAPEPESDTDGVFTYAVDSVDTATSYNDTECGQTLNAGDGAEYLVIAVTAEHTGNGPAWPATSMGEVTGYTADGTSFTTEDEMCGFLEELNPGSTATYDVVIEAPEGTELAVLQMSSMEAPDVATIEATKS